MLTMKARATEASLLARLHSHTLAEHEMPAEIRGHAGNGVAEKRDADAGAPRAGAAHDEGRRIEADGGDVEQRVCDADLARRLVVDLRPIRDPGDGRGQRAGDADADSEIGGIADAVAVAHQLHRVHRQRGGPCADRNVRQRRMDRMPEPFALQQIGDTVAEGVQKLADGRLHSNELELRLANLHRRLGVAAGEAQRNNYASASAAAREFFDGCGAVVTSDAFASQPRTRIAFSSYAAQRDEIMSQLASADPQVKERLASMFLTMDGVLARRD